MKLGPRRRIGIATGLVLGATVITWSTSDANLQTPGPMNTGHAGLACADCHHEAPGSVRQQLQNAARDLLGMDASAVDIGYRKVGNDECLACHERPDDRHPVFRFIEPRFAAAREVLHPEQCASCHREHHGTRVTAVEPTYCQHCHADTAFENDPLDISHRVLVAARGWATCLGCHDYHGNHAHQAPRRVRDAIGVEAIRRYFDGGASPYAAPVRRALTTPREVSSS